MDEEATIGCELSRAVERLRTANVPEPRRDAEVLLGWVLSRERTWLYAHDRDGFPARLITKYRTLISQRVKRCPVQYLTGRQEFMGLDFAVNPTVLIPRPETEHLVEVALREIAGNQAPILIDVGTGSGAVAIALAYHRPGSRVYATDCSAAALQTALSNAARLGVAGSIVFRHGDLLEPLQREVFPGSVAVIVANLPYIPSEEIDSLQPEVEAFEPRLALDGGDDGLQLYRRLTKQAGEFLASGGALACEAGAGQADKLAWIFEESGFGDLERVKDYAGWERVVIGRRP